MVGGNLEIACTMFTSYFTGLGYMNRLHVMGGVKHFVLGNNPHSVSLSYRHETFMCYVNFKCMIFVRIKSFIPKSANFVTQ